MQRNQQSKSGRRVTGFTLIELLVVISIIGLLAGLVVGLAGVASKKSKEARVRTDLNQLITLIEGYKAKIGFYPPDNVVNLQLRTVNPLINQLFYELSGMVVTPAGQFHTAAKDETIPPAAIKSYFNTDGFVNVAGDARELKCRASFKADQYREISSNPDVEILVVPVEWPKNRTLQPVPTKPGLNPWRYVSTNPTNNGPGKFDLWAEFILGGKTNIISNWSPETIVLGK